jgi:hypothetical protein
MTMHVSSGASDGSSSLRRPKTHLQEHPDVAFDRTLTVSTQTLDSWAQRAGIQPDMLWLDMQGYELSCLQASPAVLSGVSVIHTEVFLTEQYACAPLYHEVRDWLGRQGFAPIVERIDWDTGGNVLLARVA